ncbi:MAG: DUF1329 domain-containing protein [Pseudomonadota bacterium]
MAHYAKFRSRFSRRDFGKLAAGGVLSTGVLAPLWPTIAKTGSFTRAYPDELLSIEEYTGGKISTGDYIDASNIEHVEELFDPIRLSQIKDMGRRMRVVPTTTDIYRMSPYEYIEATLSNQGKARFDEAGNVRAPDGGPWIGGHPFPDAKTAEEVFSGLTLSWGRHDVSLYAIKEFDVDDRGEVIFGYEVAWCEYAATGRIVIDPKPHRPGFEDKLRYQSIFFTAPNSAKGTSFLNIWYYDQAKFPDLYGYLPQFKRVRRLPTNQRFEPLIPGSTLYLSDAWAAGDPFLTWGNYKILGSGPALAGISGGWNSAHPNWEHTVHGGPKGQTFWDTDMEIVPEAILVEAEPVKYPRAPISKKWVWFDARTMLPISMVSFDRQGKPYRSFDGAYGYYDDGTNKVMDGKHPYWSWGHVHVHDIQVNRVSRLEQVKKVSGGISMKVNDPSLYDKYLTQTALRQLGT